jgi:cytochrome P450 family 135
VSTRPLPAGPSRPAFAQALDWARRPLPFLDECHRRYGDAFTVRFPGVPPIVMLSDPEAVQEVFTGDPEVLRSGEANALLQVAFGRRSLVLLDGEQHRQERRLLMPAFHGERMQGYGELIAGVAERRIAEWPAGEPFAVAPSMRAIALEVIVRAIFGVEEPERIGRLEQALRRYLDVTTAPMRFLMVLLFTPGGTVTQAWRRYAPTTRRIDAVLHDEIHSRRSDPELGERTDILSLLLQARDADGEPIDDEHAHDELMTLLIAGHETTATALAWALERLAHEPGALERLEDETYLDAVVKETLRVRPVVPLVIRRLAAPVTLAAHDLPAGVSVAPCVYLVHRRADIYPEPDAFRPERFLEQPAGTSTWIPFGGGTRRCIGGAFAMLEMKTVLRAVARAGRLAAAEAGDEPAGRRGITLAPVRGGRIVWHPRTGSGLQA